MPNRNFVAIWLVLFSLPFFFFFLLPLFGSFGVVFDQTVTDPYKYEDILDLHVPMSIHMGWNVQFELQGYARGYRLVPELVSFTNWSASTSIGAFWSNLSLFLNGEEIYNWVNIYTVPNDSTGVGSVGYTDPPEDDVSNTIDFSGLITGQNNLTIAHHLYSVIDSPGEAKMVIEIGPLELKIMSPGGLDFIPNAAQPLPDVRIVIVSKSGINTSIRDLGIGRGRFSPCIGNKITPLD